jgi:hypothetical protein
MTTRWQVYRETYTWLVGPELRADPRLTWTVRSPQGHVYGAYTGTCRGHQLAVAHATECARSQP